MFAKNESMILLTGREISMSETTALSPHLGVALKWRGVLLTPHRTTVHGDEAFSG